MNQYHALIATLNAFSAKAEKEPVAFGEAMDKLDHSAYTFTAILAILPFLQPIPLGFFALIGSAAFIALGMQLYKGEPLLLPEKIRRVTLTLRTRQTLVRTCVGIINFCRRFAKPRLSFIVKEELSKRIGGFIFIAVGLFVAIPLGGVIPFKNLFPSLAIILYCIGEIEHDGLMILLALISLLLTVIFYSVIIYVAWKFGSAAIHHFFWK